MSDKNIKRVDHIFKKANCREILDKIIAEYAPEWPLDQIAAIDRNILRQACWEFAAPDGETPLKVAINEAVELAKLNIITVKNLAEADAVVLARKIGKSATTIRRWQAEAMQWLQPDRPKKKSG